MRLSIVGMVLRPFSDKYSCVEQDLLHIAVHEQAIVQYEA